MGMRAAALGATKLLQSVALATFSDIVENRGLLRHPGPPFPPLFAMRTALLCAVRWHLRLHQHLQGIPGSSYKAACKVALYEDPGVGIQGRGPAAAHPAALRQGAQIVGRRVRVC